MIKKYTKKDGTTAYKLSAYLGVDPMTGKQVRTTRQGFKTIKEAKRAEVKLVEEFQRQGAWKNNDRTTFDEVAKMWLDQYKNTVKASTFLTTNHYYFDTIKPLLGDKAIAKISAMMCQKVINNLSDLSAMSLYISVINRIFKFAIHLNIIDVNPMDRTMRPRSTAKKKEPVFYSKEEINAFLNAVKETEPLEYQLVYRILFFGGLRIGECIVLEDTDFNFKDNTISITKTFAKTLDGVITGTPKTKKSIREVSMDTETMELAKRIIRQSVKPLHESFRLFNFSPDSVRCNLRNVIKRNNFRAINLHGFRHTHASLLFESGVPAKVAQERLGHSKIFMTLDTYTHLAKDKADGIGDKVADYIVI